MRLFLLQVIAFASLALFLVQVAEGKGLEGTYGKNDGDLVDVLNGDMNAF